jgi:hypothetical protein
MQPLSEKGHIMTESSKSLPRWAQWAAGLALLATALTAGGLSLAVNVIAGLGIGLAVAIAYGLADCGKLLLPIVCQAIGWRAHTRIAYLTVSLVSVLCAVLYLADQNGGDLLKREHAATVQTDNAKQVAELEAQLADLRAMVATEAATGCGPNCKALQARADEAAQALKEARTARANATAVTLPGSAVLAATVAGTDASHAAKSIAIAKSIAALAVMELLAHLAGAAAALIGSAMRKPAIARQPVARKSAKAVASLKAEALAAAPKSGTRAWYLARLERERPAIASRVHAGELSVYAACIEAGLRKAPKVSAKWTKAEDYEKALEPA